MFGFNTKPHDDQTPKKEAEQTGAAPNAAPENDTQAEEQAGPANENHSRKDDPSFGQFAKYALKYFIGLPAKWGIASKNITSRQIDGFMDAGFVGKTARIAAASAVGAFASLVIAGQLYTLNNYALPEDNTRQGSAFVNRMVTMIEEEADEGYGPSAAFYRPSYYNLNRNAFQRGEMDAWWTVMNGMQQYVMTDGTGQANDPDLVAAFNSLKRTNEWSISSAADTAAQLGKAASHLKRYNDGLIKGKKVFVPTIANINYIAPIMSGLLLTEHNNVMDAVENNWKYNIYGNREVYFHALGVMRAMHEMSKGIFADHAEVLALQSTTAHAKDVVQRLGTNVGESRTFISKNTTFVLNGHRGDFVVSDLATLANDLLRAKDKMDDLPKNFGGAAAPSGAGNSPRIFTPAPK